MRRLGLSMRCRPFSYWRSCGLRHETLANKTGRANLNYLWWISLLTSPGDEEI
jgi:hypothetical protein